jgi:choline dehydrogenase
VPESFDHVIVGAGSSGCVLANRLSADPARKVLLLEAGGADTHPMLAVPIGWTSVMQMPRFGWGYFAEPEASVADRALPLPRGRLLGGTSSINGMMYVRGQAEDYDGWAQMGLKGWSYAEVLPYFRRSERSWRGEGPYHGEGGPLRVVPQPRDPVLTPKLIETAERLGWRANPDANGAVQEGFGVPDFTIEGGRRASTSRAFLAPAMSRSNLVVRTGAHVSRIMLERGKAVGVEYLRSGRVEQVFAGETILSGGAFGSPQMLMLSGIGPAEHLAEMGVEVRHGLPGVGRNLQDHPLVLAVYQAAGAFSFHEELRLDRLAALAAQWALFGTGALSHMPLPVQGFVRLAPGQASPDTQFQVSSVSMMAQPWFPGWRSSPGHHFTPVALQLRPHGRGEVSLRSADPAAPPRIRQGLFQHEADKDAARRMFAFIREFFATEPAAKLVSAELLPGPAARTQDEIDAHIRATIQTGMHPACTCAMGLSEEAVVDAELKVRGLEGLRVADCSVMPNVVSGNTNAPAIMIAEKAADMILGRAPPPPAELSPSAPEKVPAP